MTQISAKRIFAVAALVPLLLLGSLRPSTEAEVEAGARAANAASSYQLASLKAEARSLAVHIDGP